MFQTLLLAIVFLMTCVRFNCLKYILSNYHYGPRSRHFSFKAKRSDETIIHKLPRVYCPEINSSIKEAFELNSDSKPQLMITNSDVMHYLLNVMRIQEDHYFRIFNENSGEFKVKVISSNKKQGKLTIQFEQQLKDTKSIDDLPVVLYFAPIKKTNLKTILSKATELGVSHMVPVITQNTNNLQELEKIHEWRKYLIESAEQCERLTIPTLYNPISLKDLGNLNNIGSHTPTISKLLIAKERLLCSDRNNSLWYFLQGYFDLSKTKHNHVHKSQLLGVLCGPEGGFTKEEFELMNLWQHKDYVSLGPTILRSETAVISLLSNIAIAYDATRYQY